MNSLSMTAEQLRKKTQAAISAGRKKRVEDLQRQREEAQRQTDEQTARANEIILGLSAKCEDAASKGQNSVVVMPVKERVDYIVPDGARRKDPDVLETSWLIGTALLVLTACTAAGLDVHFAFDYSSGGEDSWHNLTVTW